LDSGKLKIREIYPRVFNFTSLPHFIYTQINITDGPFKIQLEPAYQRNAGMATVTGCFDGFE